jgi:hypothetical protein
LRLPNTLPLNAYASNDSGNLEPVHDPKPLEQQLQLCGPIVEPSCPIRLPGYVVTERNAFRCIAPSEQVECKLSVDLGDCGLGGATGTLAMDGGFVGTISAMGCTLEALAPDDAPSGTAGFAVSCGGRRFVATYMEVLFGTAACPRRGPSIFDSGRARNFLFCTGTPSLTGVITGFKAVEPQGARERYLILGSGEDDCAYDGCCFNNNNCATNCSLDCYMSPVLLACANAFNYASCVTDTNAKDDCYARCVSNCAQPVTPYPGCYRDAAGHHLASTSTSVPEKLEQTVDFEARAQDPALGYSALALVGDAGAVRPLVIAATRGAVHLYSVGTSKTIIALETASATIAGALLAGVASGAGQGDAVAYGRTMGPEPKGYFVPMSIGPMRISLRTPSMIGELASIDAADLGGPNGSYLFAISTHPPLGSPIAHTVVVRNLQGGPDPPPVTLPGRPTALVALPGGGALAGVVRDDGTAEVELVASSGGTLSDPMPFKTFGRLRVTAMTRDPSCSSGSSCRVYMGYEQVGDTTDSGNALVGIFDYNPTSPTSSRLVPSFVRTAAPQLSTLEYDAFSGEVVAISSAQNQITKISVVR